jgi:hypothetical protein
MTIELLILFAVAGLLAMWVMLPLLPAVLIYRLFPKTEITVSGPFAGLTVNASGAFAGYLVVFAAVYLALVPQTMDMIASWQRQFWTIKGDIKLVRADGSDHPYPRPLLDKLKVVQPLTHTFHDQATLKLEEVSGALPAVRIEIPGFGEEVIPEKSMQPGETTNRFRRMIVLKQPIIIRETPSGGATRPAASTQARSEQVSTESSDRPGQ